MVADPAYPSLSREPKVQFTVGFKARGKAGHVTVAAEDALIAALKVKMQLPDALIVYVRRANRRGDARHPAGGLVHEET